MKRYLILLGVLLSMAPIANAQIGTGELPITMLDTIIGDSIHDSLITVIVLGPVDTTDTIVWGSGDTIVEDLEFGVEIDTEIDFMTQSDIHIFPSGELRVLKIRSPGARALSFVIDDYVMPPGSTLHLYSEDRQYFIGGFTDFNNRSDGLFATQLIPGEAVVFEYFKPTGESGTPVINIDEVVHDRIGILTDLEGEDSALYCSPNVACSQGDPWRDEIRATVRLAIGRELCSGVLLNNTSEDGTAYVLTGLHCFDRDEPKKNGFLDANELQNARSVVAYFNHQTFDCLGNDDTYDGKVPNPTLSAGEVVSYNKDTDFALIRFEQPPPARYAPYYAGWDISGVIPESDVAAISHPRGDRKKMALDEDDPIPVTNDYWDRLLHPVLEEWMVQFEEGHTEGGSSGSPLFEQGGYVVGQLVGGTDVDCNSKDVSFYGRLSRSWVGSNPGNRLSDWLDPSGIGTLKMPGMDPICQAGIILDNKVYAMGTTDSENGWVQIQTANNVEVEDGAEVTYAARNNVKLMPGFKVDYEGKFLARINPQEDCSSHPITAIIGDNVACKYAHSSWHARTMFGKPPYTYSWSNTGDEDQSTDFNFTRWVGLLDGDFTVELETTDVYGNVAKANKPITTLKCGFLKNDNNETVVGEQPITFVLYPNPSNGMITIAAEDVVPEGKTEVEVYNMLGAKVSAFSFSGPSATFDLHSTGAGVYLVKLYSQGFVHQGQVIVH